jgi:predicted  nucleic acid-binding Zn-ribbon protein
MNAVKEIKENPRCVASITVKVKGRYNLNLNNKKQKIMPKQKSNSC